MFCCVEVYKIILFNTTDMDKHRRPVIVFYYAALGNLMASKHY